MKLRMAPTIITSLWHYKSVQRQACNSIILLWIEENGITVDNDDKEKYQHRWFAGNVWVFGTRCNARALLLYI
jgi:hypothetical protein